MTRCKSIAVLATLMFGLAGNAAAELNLQIGAERLRWREHDAAGQRLLEERGPRVRVGGEWRLMLDERYLFQLHGALYLGQVEYDGQACILGGACSPYVSDTNYFGGVAEVTLARRFGADAGPELFVGASVDHWVRDIEGDAAVQGAIEDWTVFSVNAGVGAYWRVGAATRFHLRAGVKYPFYTYEIPNLYDVTLAPKGRPSFFAKAAADFLHNGHPAWGLGLYYDSYRFAESDREAIGSIVVWQPASRQDLIGLFVTIYLR
jgi:hypothetical protein